MGGLPLSHRRLAALWLSHDHMHAWLHIGRAEQVEGIHCVPPKLGQLDTIQPFSDSLLWCPLAL
jgi:hypothetical protein